jgi:hypothetical protein
MRWFIKRFLILALLFASVEGGSGGEADVERVYNSLKPRYESFADIRERAKSIQKARIISAVLAIILLLVFIKFFKLTGLIVAAIMIVAGYFVLQKREGELRSYQTLYKNEIITPLTKSFGGFSYSGKSVTLKDIQEANLFRHEIKEYTPGDIYSSKEGSFAFIEVVLDTKENASVERMNQNRFRGFFIKSNTTPKSSGVMVSREFIDKIASMDLEVATLFGKGKRVGTKDGFDIYGEIDERDFHKVLKFSNQPIAVSFNSSGVYIFKYSDKNPFIVDVLGDFTLKSAKDIADTAKEIQEVISAFE